MNKPCILFAASPKATKKFGLSSAVGSIHAHVDFLKKRGAVFWDVCRGNEAKKKPELNEIKTGYIYNVPEKAITYKVDIEFIKSSEEIDAEYQESWEKYVPKFRLDDFPGHDMDLYWMKITGISQLTKNYTAGDFIKYKDKKPFGRKYVVGYDIAIDPDYPSKPYEINPQKEIDEIINRCIDDRKYDEKDIEDVVEKWLLRQNFEFVDRQQATGDGRIDVVYKDKKGVYYVIEIKKDADEKALPQLKGYMGDIKDKHGPNIKGIILCRTSLSSLTEAVEKERNIQIKNFRFSVDFDEF
jgi:hypothetical protein